MKKIFVIIICIFIFPLAVNAYDKAIIDVTKMDINEISEFVDKGYITYEQIMRIYIDRIEAYNEKYHVFITINENALEEAKQKDIEFQEGKKTNPIFGLPVIIKDNINVIGMPTTIGTKALFDAYPDKNASLVQKLIDKGAIIIGKSNMSEFAYSAYDSLSSYGHTYNAYNTLYSSYGSSGGTAVAVAANLAVAGIGSDTNSSIRVPAASNNLVGLRPTYGIVSGDGIAKYDSNRDTAGPITRFVSDNALLMEIIDEVDISYTTDLKDTSLEGVTIGVLSDFMNPNSKSGGMASGPTSKEIYDLMVEAIKVLEEKGATIKYIHNFYNNYYEWDATTFCMDFNQFVEGTTSHIRNLQDLINDGRYIKPVSEYNTVYCNVDYRATNNYKSLINRMTTFKNYILNQFEKNKVDVVLYPTIKTKQFKISELNIRKFYGASWSIAPATGFPSISVPIGFWEDLPYGMELLSTANNESLLYKIAYNYELKTNNYVNPETSPSLYEIPINLEALLGYYEDYKDSKRYSDINDEVKAFLNNYSNVENGNERIDELMTKYQTLPTFVEDIKNNVIENKNKSIYIGVGTLSLLLLSLLIISKKRKRR